MAGGSGGKEKSGTVGEREREREREGSRNLIIYLKCANSTVSSEN